MISEPSSQDSMKLVACHLAKPYFKLGALERDVADPKESIASSGFTRPSVHRQPL